LYHHKSLKTPVFPEKTICFHGKNNLFSAEKQLVFNRKTICFCRENKTKSAGFFFLLIFYKYDVYIKSISYFCTIKSKLKIFYYY